LVHEVAADGPQPKVCLGSLADGFHNKYIEANVINGILIILDGYKLIDDRRSVIGQLRPLRVLRVDITVPYT